MISKSWTLLLGFAMAVAALPELPQQTGSPYIKTSKTSPTTTSLTSIITSAPQSLHCTNGSTAVTTTDCTVGSTYSFCYKQPPPLTCDTSSYPSSYDCGECEICTGCFPVNAPYLTTTCAPGNGQYPYSTRTIFNGTLAGGTTTTILQVECECHSDEWYSWGTGTTNFGPYCMPRTNCPHGMTTSISTNSYCLTETCTPASTYWPYCECAKPNQTPLYPSEGAYPTGCAKIVAPAKTTAA